MKDYLVLDLETQNEFSDVGGRAYPHLLKISVAGVFSYKQNKYLIFEEKKISELEDMIRDAGLVIGFNTKYFDYAVLQPYMKKVNLKNIPSCDIMEDVANVLGHRLSLDSIAKATLGSKKIGDGLGAIKYFREGNMDALKKYCLEDVKITKEIFDYGRRYNELFYLEKHSDKKMSVPVYWEDYAKAFDNKNTSTASVASVKEEVAQIEEPSFTEDLSGNYSLF